MSNILLSHSIRDATYKVQQRAQNAVILYIYYKCNNVKTFQEHVVFD